MFVISSVLIPDRIHFYFNALWFNLLAEVEYLVIGYQVCTSIISRILIHDRTHSDSISMR